MISSISPPPMPEEVVLLTCLRFYFGTATASEVTSLLTVDLDWETLVQTAIDRGLMPLLYQSLKEIEVKLVPQSVMMQLQILTQMNGIDNITKTKELLKILSLLESKGIEAIAFKGSILATSIYGDIALRQFNDLDILVRLQDFWQTKAILVDRGYQSYLSKEMEIDLFNNHFQVPLSYQNPAIATVDSQFQPSLFDRNPALSIDLHWGIPPRRIFNPDRCDRLWDNHNSIDLIGQEIKTFSPEVTLVIQCLNAGKEFEYLGIHLPIKQVCDVAKVIQTYSNLNWNLALKISSQLQVQKLFLIGLFMTQNLLQIALPQLILEKIARSLGNIAIQPRNHQNLWQLLVNPLTTINWSWYGMLVIWSHLKRAVLPCQKDIDYFPLPARLFFLYYVIRPIRLLVKYLPFSLHR